MRPIDADAMLEELKPVTFEEGYKSMPISDVSKIMREWVSRQPTITSQAEPLTFEQLRQMDGQPVWIKRLKDLSVCDTGWALIEVPLETNDKILVWWPGSEAGDAPSEEDYGKTWVAYGRPPERQED